VYRFGWNSRKPGEILFFFCQASNAQFYRFPVRQISRNLNSTRQSLRQWILSEQNFENFLVGVVFPKKCKNRIFSNVLRLQAAITSDGHKLTKNSSGDDSEREHFMGNRLATSIKVAWAEAYFHAKYHLDPSCRFDTINTGRKFGGLRSLLGEGERGPHLTQSRLGRGLAPCRVASWSMQPFGRNRYGPKIRGLCAFRGGGDGTPSNTVWPGPRPTCIQVSSWSVQPFGHNTPTSETDMTDNGPIA